MNGALPIDRATTTDTAAPAASGVGGYVMLFVPFVLATVLSPLPTLSYLVAWAGSAWILMLTIGGYVKPLPPDRSLLEQFMRPVILTHFIFAFYNFLSSIFYFADLNGYYYLSRVSTLPVSDVALALTAEAQRYYVLAHAGVATGMLAVMDYRKSGEWAVREMDNPVAFLLLTSALAFGLETVFGGALGQIAERLSQLGLVASVLALSLALPTRRGGLLLVAGGVYALNLMNAFLSGFKENVFVMVMLLAVFAYPYAKKTVTVGAPIALFFLVAILPTYANVFRSLNWDGDATDTEAAAVAFESIQTGEEDIAANNWAFLTGRISEIGLFKRYIAALDLSGDHYGTTILAQSAMSLVPRAVWPSKPITESLVMERVYENGIVSRSSTVSAKPQYVVDGYLSFGIPGMLMAGVVLGLFAGLASRVCERYFGGYFWGTGLMYTSFFAIFWKGNTFEFFFNTVVWSFILLVPVFLVAKGTGILVRRDEQDGGADVSVATEHSRVGRSGPRSFWAPS